MNRHESNNWSAQCITHWKDQVLKHCKIRNSTGITNGDWKGPTTRKHMLQCRWPNGKPGPEKTPNKCHKDQQKIIAHVTRRTTKQIRFGCLIKQSFVCTVKTTDQSQDFRLHAHSNWRKVKHAKYAHMYIETSYHTWPPLVEYRGRQQHNLVLPLKHERTSAPNVIKKPSPVGSSQYSE